MNKSAPIIIGISGASGIFYSIELLSILRELDVFEKIYLIITASARRVYKEEVLNSQYEYPQFIDDIFLKKKTYSDIEEFNNRDIGALIASGSHTTSGMLILPSSTNTLSSIALGLSDTLITRAALVSLKEKRRLIIVLREAPYTEIIVNNMLRIIRNGGVVMSATPGFYIKDNTNLKKIIRSFINKILHLLNAVTVTHPIKDHQELEWKN